MLSTDGSVTLDALDGGYNELPVGKRGLEERSEGLDFIFRDMAEVYLEHGIQGVERLPAVHGFVEFDRRLHGRRDGDR